MEATPPIVSQHLTIIRHPFISPRRRLKCNNFLIWDLIFYLIEHRNLQITTEVKGHSNNEFNDRADILASLGAECVDPIIVNYKFFSASFLGYFNWNQLYICDQNIRQWANTSIRANIFNSMLNNSSLTLIEEDILQGHVDWHFTKLWINFNPFDSPTSEKVSRHLSTKVKKSNFIYPTADILQRNYLRLYLTGPILCPNCHTSEDTNAHIGLCTTHHRNILTSGLTYELLDQIGRSSVFAFIDTFRPHNILLYLSTIASVY